MAATTTRASSTSEAAEPRRPRSFRPDIEGLRALAIIPVLVFHAHEFLSPSATGLFGVVATVLGWVPGGFVGPDDLRPGRYVQARLDDAVVPVPVPAAARGLGDGLDDAGESDPNAKQSLIERRIEDLVAYLQTLQDQ